MSFLGPLRYTLSTTLYCEQYYEIWQHLCHRREIYCNFYFIRSAYRHELQRRLSHKPWISKVTDWPRRRSVAEFRLSFGHDCLGTRLHRIGIHPDPYCTLCSLHEPMDGNHLRHCTALSNKTEYERYWEARTKMMEN